MANLAYYVELDYRGSVHQNGTTEQKKKEEMKNVLFLESVSFG